MGNSQNPNAQTSPYIYIQPKKINPNQSQPLNDIEAQLQNIFGINHASSNLEAIQLQSRYIDPKLLQSIPIHDKQNWRDRRYEDRISHLQQQILYLKSIIEQSKSRSRRESPVCSESSNRQEEQNSIQQSRSRVSLTYFQSREQQRQ